MARLALAALFLSVAIAYVLCMMVVVVAASERWKFTQRVGAATMLTLLFVGFAMHFYMQHYIARA